MPTDLELKKKKRVGGEESREIDSSAFPDLKQCAKRLDLASSFFSLH